MYPEELLYYYDLIELNLLDATITAVSVASNPHRKNPDELMQSLRSSRDRIMRKLQHVEEDKFDAVGFANLKQKLADSRVIKVLPPKGGTI